MILNIIRSYFESEEAFLGKIKHSLINMKNIDISSRIFCSKDVMGAEDLGCYFFTDIPWGQINNCSCCVFHRGSDNYETFIKNAVKVMVFSDERALSYKARFIVNLLEDILIISVLVDYSNAEEDPFIQYLISKDYWSFFDTLDKVIVSIFSSNFYGMTQRLFKREKVLVETFLTACLEILEEIK